ncbi:MAG: hypothetical protein PHV37_01015 [Candidatus Gastranaerophilales bacterium]|nr:hypothetical protein [Candidatus Gastranaerophilales bacterium]
MTSKIVQKFLKCLIVLLLMQGQTTFAYNCETCLDTGRKAVAPSVILPAPYYPVPYPQSNYTPTANYSTYQPPNASSASQMQLYNLNNNLNNVNHNLEVIKNMNMKQNYRRY